MSALADQTRWMDATDQAALVASGEVSPSELLEAAIERIERIDPALNAVVIRWFDHARETAASADLPNGPFRGVPFLIKDLFATYAGQRISNGNVAFKEAHVIADADTTLVSRHRAAGLVIAGRTNSPELGSVPTTEPVAWGATHNPWDTTRTPGGSSGGAAAAVASGMVPFAHASDGGGSIRIPASCCGLVGLKPSQGRITLGPLRDESGLSVEHCVSRTVRDTAALLDATRGPGIGDTVIAPPPARPYVEELGADPGRLRIGILDHHPQGGPVDAEVTHAAQAVGKLLESLGHHVEAAWPTALEDKTFGSKFGALWSANMGLSQRRFEDQLGRPLEDRRVGADEPGPGRLRQTLHRRRLRARAVSRRPVPPGGAVVVARRLGSAAHADACRATAQARHDRQRPREPDVADASRRRFRALHSPVQHQRPTSDQPAAGVDGRGLAGRRAARRRLRSRRHPDPHRQPARAGEALGSPHTRDLSEKSAGGGTRTHTLSRAPAPKARASASFATPAAWPIVPARAPTICRQRFLRGGITAEGATMRSADEFNEVRRSSPPA